MILEDVLDFTVNAEDIYDFTMTVEDVNDVFNFTVTMGTHSQFCCNHVRCSQFCCDRRLKSGFPNEISKYLQNKFIIPGLSGLWWTPCKSGIVRSHAEVGYEGSTLIISLFIISDSQNKLLVLRLFILL